ncbi:hypothetical protein C0J52_06980 [Blattella germanica]|nr:hypothetical protein C0J52_06980 [Blattella germanica]
MGKLSSLLSDQAYFVVTVYIMMMTLMVGAMVGLVVWSSWVSSQRGIIQIPNPHYDYIIGWEYNQIRLYMKKILGTENDCVKEERHCFYNYYSLLMMAAGLQDKNDPDCEMVKENGQPFLYVNEVDTNDSELSRAFLNARKELSASFEGIKFNAAQSTVFKGQRWSSLEGYLRPILGRPNLHVLLNAQVLKVVIDHGRKVQGVELRKSNELITRVINSRQEVILSAGAINTPHILLQSGIGPRAQLQKLGVSDWHGLPNRVLLKGIIDMEPQHCSCQASAEIPVISDLHVGLNLHDHLNMPLYVSIEAPVSVTLNKVQQIHQLWNYMIHGKGLLSSSAIAGVGTAEPDIGLVLFGLGSADEKLLRDIANYKQETFRALFPFSNSTTQEGFVLLASCLQPLSRGTVTLNDIDPKDEPVIDPQYLHHQNDITCMINAVQLAIQLSSSKPFKELGAKIHLPRLEECQHLEVDANSKTYLECIIRTAAITGYHPGGTCKMGSPHDETAVTDSMLRVRGLNGLRIVDASIMPTPLSGHPNSVLIAMADRAADLILDQ